MLFLIASFLTACYTVIMQQSKLDPIHVAALVSTGSLVTYAPIYLALHGFHLAEVPLADLTMQVIFQGIAVTIISLVLYGRAVLILGASGGSAFGALVPALSALLAIPPSGGVANSIRLGRDSCHIDWCVFGERRTPSGDAAVAECATPRS